MIYSMDEIREKVAPIANRYGVEAIGLFGSYARGEADEKSDLDFVVSKGRMKSLLEYCSMVDDLEDAFSCHVDLIVRNSSRSENFWDEIARDEVMVYAR